MGALALACACGSPAIDQVRGAPDAGGRSFARLAVTLTAPRDGGVTVTAAGRLLRYRGVDLDGAQLLAGTHDRERAPLGRCSVVDDESQLEDALATSPPDAAVQMMDAGDLLVRVAGQTVKMSPRFVPDIVPFVSGVVYDGEVSSADAFGDVDLGGRDAAVVAFGGHEVSGFVTAAEVPAMPRFVAVAGTPAEASPVLETGADLPLSWSVSDGKTAVTITVARESGPALRCRVVDTGHFTVPASALARVVDRADSVAVTVERSRRAAFAAPGLDAAEVEVTTRDVVTLRVD